MNICITTKTLARGGAEVLLYMLIPVLLARGVSVDVVYFEKNNNDLSNLIEQSGAKVKYIGPLHPNCIISTIFKYFFVLRKGQYDVIFDNSPLVSVITRLLGFGKKTLYIEHSVWGNYNIITRFFNKITYRMLAMIVCCSERVYRSNGCKGFVLENAIKIKKRSEILDDKKINFQTDRVIISVANISKVKNHTMLIKAFNMLTCNNVKLLLVGEARDNIEQVIGEIAISPRKDDIIYYGPSDNVHSLLIKADIFALTSLYEGLPISVLEAMSLGVVPVCTDVGGLSNVINNKCGYLVPSKDVAQLAYYLDVLLNDNSLLQRMSSEAIKRIESSFNIENYADILMEKFKELSNNG